MIGEEIGIGFLRETNSIFHERLFPPNTKKIDKGYLTAVSRSTPQNRNHFFLVLQAVQIIRPGLHHFFAILQDIRHGYKLRAPCSGPHEQAALQ